jgi:hypothetical protein
MGLPIPILMLKMERHCVSDQTIALLPELNLNFIQILSSVGTSQCMEINGEFFLLTRGTESLTD